MIIYTDRGYVNLSRVHDFQDTGKKSDNHRHTFRLLDSKGDTLGFADNLDIDAAIERAMPVIPETSGTVLIVFWKDEGKLYHDRWPVIGWRINGEYVTPIICDMESIVNGSYWVIEHPKSVNAEAPFVQPGLASFETLDDVIRNAKRHFQIVEP